MLEILSCFLTESVEMLLRVSKQRDLLITLQLRNLIIATYVDIIGLKRHIRILAGGNNIPTCQISEIMKDEKFHKVLGRHGGAKYRAVVVVFY